MRPSYLFLSPTLLLLAACSGGSDSPKQEPTQKVEGELTEESCELDSDCDDGAFCNGTETCDEGFCRLGIAPTCDDGIECTTDSCSHRNNACLFEAPDEDGDGFKDSQCEGPDGEPLGEDCDDSDGDRFPGNPERCTPSDLDHDEDCDPITVGHLDEDLDGYVSAACCNGEGDEQICGEDCDDGDYRRYPEHPEICDEIDNDCDGEVDVNTREVLWYPDEDGDHFGIATDDAVLSCAPIEGHSLRDSDCDDATGAVHSAAVEVCDGADNDCDGETDEDGVCACAPEGNVRACACGPSATGVQSCTGGLWNQCDCTECVSGTVDCLGELLPRECIEGRWVVQASCRGIRPICLAGACVCADGTDDCETSEEDLVPPFLLATAPSDGATGSATDSISLVFSEAVRLDPADLTLSDGFGATVSGTVQSGGTTLRFTPDVSLRNGTDYQLHISGALSDLAGNPLGQDQEVLFQTETGIEPRPLTLDDDLRHTDPRLDVSPNGEAILVATQHSGESGQSLPATDGNVAFIYNGSTWGDGIIFADSFVHHVTIDDRGYASAQLLSGSDTIMRGYFGTDWDATPQLAAGYDTSVGLESTADGHVLSVSRNTQFVHIDVRDPSGVFTTSSPPLNVVEGSAAALGSPDHAIVVFTGAASCAYTRTTNAISNWTSQAVTLINQHGPLFEAAVTMNVDGLATVAHTQELTQASGRYRQIWVNDVNAEDEWSGDWIHPHGAPPRNATQVKLDGDAVGNVTMAYVSDRSTVIASRRLGSTWEPEVALSSEHTKGTLVQDLILDVAENGTIVVVWRSGAGSASDLYGAKFVEGSGWTSQLLLDGGTIGPDQVQMAVDSVGNAHIAYSQSGVFTFTW